MLLKWRRTTTILHLLEGGIWVSISEWLESFRDLLARMQYGHSYKLLGDFNFVVYLNAICFIPFMSDCTEAAVGEVFGTLSVAVSATWT